MSLARHITAVVLLLPALASAQTGKAPPPACQTAEFHQWDFWHGHWNVVDTAGVQQATSFIEPVSNGCAFIEHWNPPVGPTGVSLDFYDATRSAWVQTWMGGGGHSLYLTGAMKDGSMVLEGDGRGPGGVAIRNRLTWTPEPAGKVLQQWFQSTDGGKTWTTVFWGMYVPQQ